MNTELKFVEKKVTGFKNLMYTIIQRYNPNGAIQARYQ